jgi:hypothetical protein
MTVPEPHGGVTRARGWSPALILLVAVLLIELILGVTSLATVIYATRMEPGDALYPVLSEALAHADEAILGAALTTVFSMLYLAFIRLRWRKVTLGLLTLDLLLSIPSPPSLVLVIPIGVLLFLPGVRGHFRRDPGGLQRRRS